MGDVRKVMEAVCKHKLLMPIGMREHCAFPGLPLNPLSKWNVDKTKAWITEKKMEYPKFKGKFHA